MYCTYFIVSRTYVDALGLGLLFTDHKNEVILGKLGLTHLQQKRGDKREKRRGRQRERERERESEREKNSRREKRGEIRDNEVVKEKIGVRRDHGGNRRGDI